MLNYVSNLNLETTAQVTGSVSDGFTYTARWTIVPLSSNSTRCSIAVQCDFKGSYLSGMRRMARRETHQIDAVEASGADLVRQTLMKWNESCLKVIANYKPDVRLDDDSEVACSHLSARADGLRP